MKRFPKEENDELAFSPVPCKRTLIMQYITVVSFFAVTKCATVVAVKLDLHPAQPFAYFDETGQATSSLLITCSLGHTPAQNVMAMELMRVTAFPPATQVLVSASGLDELPVAKPNTEVLQNRNLTVKGGINSLDISASTMQLTLRGLTCADSGKYVCGIYLSSSAPPGSSVVYKQDWSAVYIAEHPSVAVAAGSPRRTGRVYKPGDVIKVTCRGFVGTATVSWFWEERSYPPGGANTSFQPLVGPKVRNLPVRKLKACRSLGTSMILYTVPNATGEGRQLRCKVVLREAAFDALGGTFTFFIGKRPPNSTLPYRELFPPNLDGRGGNLSSLFARTPREQSTRELMGLSGLWYLVGAVAATMAFLVALFLSLGMLVYWRQRQNYVQTHAMFYHKRGVDRRWGPGHAYVV